MLNVTKRKYEKQYIIGGSGIFDRVVNCFKNLMTSIAANDIAKRAMNAGQSVAIDAGKKLVEKVTTNLATSRNGEVAADVNSSPAGISQK